MSDDRHSRTPFLLSTIVLALGGSTAFVAADTLRVPSEYPTIQAGIDAAEDGDEVLVADGVYTGDGNRDLDFGGKDIVVRSENGPDNCVIDAEGTEDDPHRGFDFRNGETSAAVVQGFTIRNGFVTVHDPRGAFGAGISCLASGPTIVNCTLTANQNVGSFSGGGGIAFRNSGDVTIVSCRMMGNATDWHGGGLYCDDTNVTIVDCTAEGNHARDGAGIYCESGQFTITNGTITRNIADGAGGGVYFFGAVDALITNSTITENEAFTAGGVAASMSSVTIESCVIVGNMAANSGGGVYGRRSDLTISNCLIEANSARAGGGIYQVLGDGVTSMITWCTIRENVARATYGGGVYSGGRGSQRIAHCAIVGNIGHLGGGVYCHTAMTIANCIIIDNTAVQDRESDGVGGGVYCAGDSTIANSAIIRNTAELAGGAIYFSRGGGAIVSSCTLSENEAVFGGGITCEGNLEDSGPTVINSILWNDQAAMGREIALIDDRGNATELTVRYCDVVGGQAETYVEEGSNLIWGEGNIDADPLFTNPDNGGFRLTADSPCINAGDPNYVPEPGETDLDGHPRILCDRVDMGAYEFGIGDFDCNRAVDLFDFEQWLTCFTGPDGGPYPSGCEAFDADADGDVDWSDFATIQLAFTGN